MLTFRLPFFRNLRHHRFFAGLVVERRSNLTRLVVRGANQRILGDGGEVTLASSQRRHGERSERTLVLEPWSGGRDIIRRALYIKYQHRIEARIEADAPSPSS